MAVSAYNDPVLRPVEMISHLRVCLTGQFARQVGHKIISKLFQSSES